MVADPSTHLSGPTAARGMLRGWVTDRRARSPLGCCSPWGCCSPSAAENPPFACPPRCRAHRARGSPGGTPHGERPCSPIGRWGARGSRARTATARGPTRYVRDPSCWGARTPARSSTPRAVASSATSRARSSRAPRGQTCSQRCPGRPSHPRHPRPKGRASTTPPVGTVTRVAPPGRWRGAPGGPKTCSAPFAGRGAPPTPRRACHPTPRSGSVRPRGSPSWSGCSILCQEPVRRVGNAHIEC